MLLKRYVHFAQDISAELIPLFAENDLVPVPCGGQGRLHPGYSAAATSIFFLSGAGGRYEK
jgi:hypothetical protein